VPLTGKSTIRLDLIDTPHDLLAGNAKPTEEQLGAAAGNPI